MHHMLMDVCRPLKLVLQCLPESPFPQIPMPAALISPHHSEAVSQVRNAACLPTPQFNERHHKTDLSGMLMCCICSDYRKHTHDSRGTGTRDKVRCCGAMMSM